MTVRAARVFAGDVFALAASEAPGWLCPLVEAPPIATLGPEPALRPGAAVGDRTRQQAGPCVAWPPPPGRTLSLDTSDGRLVQTHGLDALLEGQLDDGLSGWEIAGFTPDAPDGAFVELVSRYFGDRPLVANTALAPVRDGRFSLTWRGYPWSEPLLCRWEQRGDALVGRGCTPVDATPAQRAVEPVVVRVEWGSWGPRPDDVALPIPERMPAEAQRRLDLAARCEGGR